MSYNLFDIKTDSDSMQFLLVYSKPLVLIKRNANIYTNC